MKPTFLNQNRPLITGMILKDNPDSIRFAAKNSIYDGADCLGIQLEYLKKEYSDITLAEIKNASGQETPQ